MNSLSQPHCVRSIAVAVLAAVLLTSAGCGKGNRSNPDSDGGSPAPAEGAPGGGTPGPNPPDLPSRGGAAGGGKHELYGETAGESILAADAAPPSAPLRARKADTFYKLSNPRIEARKTNTFPPPPPGSGPLLVIDYERTHERALDGNLTLVVRSGSGKDHPVQIGTLQNRAGAISLEAATSFGPFARPGGSLPTDAEFYLVRTEARYGAKQNKTFKVSNSVVMGDSRFPVTQARDWTADELKMLAVAPVEAPKPNANPNAGEDTEAVGAVNAFKQRFAEPGKPLLGVDWSDWFWPVQGGKEECLGPITPIYDRAYPDMGRQRTLAKPGYAVGAVTAKTKTYVNGIQITFMKIKSDGTLDPKDSYTSPWLGPHKVGTKEMKLGGDGRPVIGLVCYQTGALQALGLVMEAK